MILLSSSVRQQDFSFEVDSVLPAARAVATKSTGAPNACYRDLLIESSAVGWVPQH